MADYLLIGAGFSRNWGGWLAAEAFEYLLGCPEIINHSGLKSLLWQHQLKGGFESALAEVQSGYKRDSASYETYLEGLQTAIGRMFDDMNKAFFELPNWEFQHQIEHQVGTFLTRFDAIFTLNQDVLLEHHYANENVALIGKKKWSGVQFPGMRRVPSQVGMNSASFAHSTWYSEDETTFKVQQGAQPIYKMHGSSNWRHEDLRPMLVMGGAKSIEINQTPILNWYAEVFEKCLSSEPSRLMVIGYSFRDPHINSIITKGVNLGLKLFIIAPEGAELAYQLNPTRNIGCIAVPSPLETLLETSLVGASRRTLGEIFGADTAERNKVMRFFES